MTKSILIRLLLLAVALVGLFSFSGCQKEAEKAPEAPKEFSPPVDGKVGAEKVKQFLLTHEALTEVSAHFLADWDGASSEAAHRIRGALEIAREKVPRRYGLNGYAEYHWLLTEAPKNAANAALFEKHGIGLIPSDAP